jgi:hypothetical protein
VWGAASGSSRGIVSAASYAGDGGMAAAATSFRLFTQFEIYTVGR